MKTNAAAFFAIEQALTKLHTSSEKLNKQRTRSMEERLAIQRVLVEDILPLCNSCDLRVSAGFIADFSKQLSDQSLRMKSPEIMTKLDSVKTIISSEINQRIFLQIPANREEYYTQLKPLFGDQVATAFPSASYDISEAGKCLALERGTACVFHLMRAMEVCLHAFAAKLRITAITRPNWGDILRRIETAGSNDHFTLEAHILLTNCKNAWRNPTMHMEKTFTPEDAKAIFEAVNGFMRHLSKEVSEPKT